MRWVRPLVGVAFVSGVLLGCASIQNAPVNLPGSDSLADKGNIGFGETGSYDDTIIGLSFSGGGTRAAAFSYGVLKEMERIPIRGAQSAMIDRVEFVSGVSGGSVTAAYYGLRKRAALADFRERFLLRNAEEGLQTDLTLATLSRAVAGGINDSTGFPRWLDANLFQGATFRDLGATSRPQVWINASDIYNRTPFVFGAVAFGAMCSNLSEYPLANAVAASAAVPVAFAPVVMQTFPGKCNDRLPSWITRARDNANAPPMLNDDLLHELMERRVFPGEGEFETRRFADAFKTRGYGGIVSVEVLNGDWRKRDLREYAARAYETSALYWL